MAENSVLSRGPSWVDVGAATIAVEVYEARGLSCIGSCDPYATVEVEHALQKTQVLKDTTIPKWMETFHFTVVDLPKARGMIKIKARRLAVKDTLLARFIFDFNSVSLEELQSELVLPEALTKEEMERKHKVKGWSHAELLIKLKVLEDPLRGITNGKWPEEWTTIIGRENGETRCPSVKIPPSQVPCTDFEVVDHAGEVDRFFNEVNKVPSSPQFGSPVPANQAPNAARTPAEQSSLQEQVAQFYAARGIRRTDEEIQRLVAGYAHLPPGALMNALALKYDGGGSPTAEPTQPPAPAVEQQFRQQLIEFFQQHAPDRLQVINIDNVLQMYRGREDELFATLRERYRGEDQSDLRNPYRSRMKAFYTFHAPEKLHLVTPALRAYKGREEEMFTVLVRKYGPEPTEQQLAEALRQQANQDGSLAAEDSLYDPAGEADLNSPYRRRLEAYYGRYCPEKLIHVVKALRLYRGREEQLFTELVSVYGPEPQSYGPPTPTVPPQAAATPAAGSYPLPGYAGAPQPPFRPRALTMPSYHTEAFPPQNRMPNAAPVSYRNRLAAFYAFYAPEKLDMVDRALATYQGREEELFRQLAAHYGPEPAPAPQPPSPLVPPPPQLPAPPAAPVPFYYPQPQPGYSPYYNGPNAAPPPMYCTPQSQPAPAQPLYMAPYRAQ